MRHYSVNAIAFTISLLLGIIAVSPLLETTSYDDSLRNLKITVPREEPVYVWELEPPEKADEPKLALDHIWIDDDETRIDGYFIKRTCETDEIGWSGLCTLTISDADSSKIMFETDASQKEYLSYGFFNFLRTKNKQLVVFTYSGGAHCCYDYYILDLRDKLRILYDSSNLDSANEIGSELVPVDINADGVFEFHRRIETFAYFHASYAESNKPTALFAYDRTKGRYHIANAKFSEYILDDNRRILEWFEQNEPELDQNNLRFIVRARFLNYVYSGNRDLAWDYFDENYDFADRTEYRNDIEMEFKKDPTYLSIYQH